MISVSRVYDKVHSVVPVSKFGLYQMGSTRFLGWPCKLNHPFTHILLNNFISNVKLNINLSTEKKEQSNPFIPILQKIIW